MANKSYKYRLYPNETQRKQIEKTFGCCRFVWNAILAKRKELWDKEKKNLSRFQCGTQLLTPMKHAESTSFLMEADAQALLYVLAAQQDAYNNFFKRVKRGEKKVGFPKFKKKHDGEQSYRTKSSIHIKNGKIQLHKLGLVRIRGYKKIEGRIVAATVKRDAAGRYFVIVCCDGFNPQPLPKTGKSIGIDLGLRQFLVTSEGKEIANPEIQHKVQNRLKRIRRRVDRKPMSSRNRQKARQRYARLQEKIRYRRQDFVHKTSTRLIREYDTICIEDLNVEEMMEKYSRSVAQRFFDANLGNFRRTLMYKAQWYGKHIRIVDQYFASSQICSECGHKNKHTKDMHVVRWQCPHCGTIHQRDINAAKNILAEGLRNPVKTL